MSKPPVVSIGLPVFNGERYLRTAIESLLSQQFGDFELIVSDNASSDGTAAICRELAAADARVRYERQPENRGATWNFNHVAQKARGQYFMWAAHDDVWRADFIARTLTMLESDASAVCCYCEAQPIDSHGTPHGSRYIGFVNDDATVRGRWRRMMAHWELHATIYGLMRTAVLRRTRLLLPRVSADLVFMAEMALHGKILQVPEVLAWKRVPDPGATYRSPAEIIDYLEPPGARHRPPPRFHHFHVALECVRGIRHAQLSPSLEWQLTLDTFAVYLSRGYWSIDAKEMAAAVFGERYTTLAAAMKGLPRR